MQGAIVAVALQETGAAHALQLLGRHRSLLQLRKASSITFESSIACEFLSNVPACAGTLHQPGQTGSDWNTSCDLYSSKHASDQSGKIRPIDMRHHGIFPVLMIRESGPTFNVGGVLVFPTIHPLDTEIFHMILMSHFFIIPTSRASCVEV